MDFHDEEFLNVFKSLNRHSVDHILIGGFAVNFHGHSRFTADLDIWIRDSPENRKKLSTALTEIYGYEIPGVETMQFVPGWSTIALPNGFPLDILVYMKGLEEFTYDECLSAATDFEVEGTIFKVLHYNHLIANKKAAGRPKDLLDIEELKKINGD
jgi:predicted nucleotidyltransferase